MNPVSTATASAMPTAIPLGIGGAGLRQLLTTEWVESASGRDKASSSRHRILMNIRAPTLEGELCWPGLQERCLLALLDVIVVPAGVPVSWRFSPQSSLMQVGVCRSQLVRVVWQELGMRLASSQLRAGCLRQIPEIGRTALELTRDEDAARRETSLIFQALWRIFLLRVLEHAGDLLPVANRLPARLGLAQFRKAARFIARNYSDRITLHELAGQVPMSPWHFSRLFKATTGYSPMQFVLLHRVEQGMRQVADTDDRLVRIALRCGFSDQAHFNRVFKRCVGLTPSQYRKRFDEPF